MEEIKQGCYATLKVTLDGVDMEDVAQVEFLFKQQPGYLGEALKRSVWKSDGSGDAKSDTTAGSDAILIPWSRSETYRFAGDCPFYMDTRITLANDTVENPFTPIISLLMNGTLFEEVGV